MQPITYPLFTCCYRHSSSLLPGRTAPFPLYNICPPTGFPPLFPYLPGTTSSCSAPELYITGRYRSTYTVAVLPSDNPFPCCRRSATTTVRFVVTFYRRLTRRFFSIAVANTSAAITAFPAFVVLTSFPHALFRVEEIESPSDDWIGSSNL